MEKIPVIEEIARRRRVDPSQIDAFDRIWEKLQEPPPWGTEFAHSGHHKDALSSGGIYWNLTTLPSPYVTKKALGGMANRLAITREIIDSEEISRTIAVKVHVTDEVDPDLRRKFRILVEKWRSETMFTSSATELFMHPVYQRIIGMGPDVVPVLLRELEREPDHWFWALTAITGENPVALQDTGDLRKMTRAWLRWGREHHLI